MGKAEVGTPKWISNKLKSKGLQKLRWYCQMCEKQCRDENGFKCHTMSEAHQRQMLIFSDSPHKFLDSYSKEFEDGFLNLLKRAHNTKRVYANQVYQEYIRDKNHVHMNATQWVSLTGFVKYLGRTGKCVVDETEKGWYITWIDRDPETIARQDALKKKEKMVKDDEEKMAEFISKQVERVKGEQQSDQPAAQFTELKRESDQQKIQLNDLKLIKKDAQAVASSSASSLFSTLKRVSSSEKGTKSASEKRKMSALEEIMMAEEAAKAKKSRERPTQEEPDGWLQRHIVVKIVTKSLGDAFYKQKGYVKDVVDKYAAVVILLSDSKTKVKLDQDHLETVIPGIGKPVLILRGEHCGKQAELVELHVEKFAATLELNSGSSRRQCIQLPYEHFSKMYKP